MKNKLISSLLLIFLLNGCAAFGFLDAEKTPLPDLIKSFKKAYKCK